MATNTNSVTYMDVWVRFAGIKASRDYAMMETGILRALANGAGMADMSKFNIYVCRYIGCDKRFTTHEERVDHEAICSHWQLRHTRTTDKVDKK